MPCLTIIDVTGIQNYIFGSNRLKEIVGGSEIVAQATSNWAFEVLLSFNDWQTNLKDSEGSWFDLIDKSRKIEDGISAELIYAGGGNTVILFKSETEAKDFARKYTRKLIEEAAGLEVVIAHSNPFEMAEGKIILERLGETFIKLGLKKSNRKVSAPLFGLAVSAQCVSTGGVATSYDGLRGNYVSTESQQKLDFAEKANHRLQNEICQELEWKGLSIPLDFDDLGRTRDEASYIAVVHTDGNGMGERFKQNRAGQDNRECVEKMRKFSREIYEANVSALKATIEEVLNHIESATQTFKSSNGESFNLIQSKDQNETYFPFRPLIFGGDDLTFVCDGRIALALTSFYLEKLKGNLLDTDQKPIYARAGISIVKTHYPFRRAYELAEDLAKSAKARIREIDKDSKEVFALDWHVAMSGLLGNVEEIRLREYLGGKLCMRPIILGNHDWRTWDSFIEIINEFQTEWKDKRSKVKRLREVLRGGRAKTREFLTLFKEKLPSNIAEHGWDGDRCVHFDAIEMLDLFYPLEKIEERQQEQKN
jgi:hypothetical protein